MHLRYCNTGNMPRLLEAAKKAIMVTGLAGDITTIAVFTNYADAKIMADTVTQFGQDKGIVYQYFLNKDDLEQRGRMNKTRAIADISRRTMPEPIRDHEASMYYVPMTITHNQAAKIVFKNHADEKRLVSIDERDGDAAEALVAAMYQNEMNKRK